MILETRIFSRLAFRFDLAHPFAISKVLLDLDFISSYHKLVIYSVPLVRLP